MAAEEIHITPIEDVRRLDYERLLTPNQKKAHAGLRSTLDNLFAQFGPDDERMYTELDGNWEVQTILLASDPKDWRENLVFAPVVQKVTHPDGEWLYSVTLPVEVIGEPTRIEMQARGGKHIRGYRPVATEYEFRVTERQSFVVLPNMTLRLDEQPYLIAPAAIKELRQVVNVQPDNVLPFPNVDLPE